MQIEKRVTRSLKKLPRPNEFASLQDRHDRGNQDRDLQDRDLQDRDLQDGDIKTEGSVEQV
jgi:hypothetical protein